MIRPRKESLDYYNRCESNLLLFRVHNLIIIRRAELFFIGSLCIGWDVNTDVHRVIIREMGRCVIPTCRNNSHKTRTTDKNTKYHVFPKDAIKRSEWIKKLRSDNWIPDSNTCVCSEHFLPSDFERDLKAELLKLPPKRILKPEAVPSVNLSHTSETPNSEKKKLRIANGQNKENEKNTSKVKPNIGYVISYLGKKPQLYPVCIPAQWSIIWSSFSSLA